MPRSAHSGCGGVATWLKMTYSFSRVQFAAKDCVMVDKSESREKGTFSCLAHASSRVDRLRCVTYNENCGVWVTNHRSLITGQLNV